MEALYQQTNSQLQQLQFTLGRLEQCSNESEAQPLFQSAHQQMETINGNCRQLDNYVHKVPPTRRSTAKQRVDQLKYDCQSVNSAIGALQMRLTNKWRAMSEREELLTQRFKPNETHLTVEDTELLVNDRLRQSHNAVDDLIAQGTAVLSSIRSQGMNLHGVKRKVLDIGQTLGLSSTTLRMIEKRLDEDWWVFIVGCILVLIFMYCFYRFWKG
ncbi:membrin [Aphelenchoides avenae]|nr:membrin [Aphelenchus avenae]